MTSRSLPDAAAPRARASDHAFAPATRPPRGQLLKPLLVVLIFLTGVAAAKLPQTISNLRGKAGWIDQIREIHGVITILHADEPDQEAMQRRTIEGMLEALDDRYAEYIPPDDKDDFEKELTGSYSGIGAEIEIRDGWLTIVAPLEESPALRAGILPNDRVISIEGETTFRLSADECIKRLVGPEGTPVNITIMRNGKEIPFTLTRQRIHARSVRGLKRIYDDRPAPQTPAADGAASDPATTDPAAVNHDVHWDYLIDPADRIAYIRLSQFTPTAAEELLAALGEATKQAKGEPAGLILDLRGNPGGSLEAAIQVADIFLPDGDVVSVRGRAVPDQVFESESNEPLGGRYEQLPVVVLVDQVSASASEIVSGALQDRGRAVVVGSRSFGKGLVQSVIPLSLKQDAQLKFTTAKYYLPSGRLIQREDDSAIWGVDPDPGYYVPETDDQLVERIIQRRKLDGGGVEGPDEDNAPASALHWDDPAWIETTAADRALAGALRALRGRVETGAFTPLHPGSDAQDQHQALAADELRRLERAERLITMDLARIAKRIDSLWNSSATGERPSNEPLDLWSDELNLTDGSIAVRDKDGNLVTTLKITGRDLERWLANADVKPSDADPDAAAAPTHAQPKTP